MFQGFLVTVTAAAVLWHTVAGCCAHHAHGQPARQLGVVASLPGLSTSCGAKTGQPCRHAHSPSASRGESRGSTLVPALAGASDRDSDEPPSCTEGSCVFAAPDSTNALPMVELDEHGLFLSSSLTRMGSGLHAPSRAEDPGRFERTSQGGLRRHLALGVLLL